jgi:hypothetical protein
MAARRTEEQRNAGRPSSSYAGVREESNVVRQRERTAVG